MSYLAQSAPNKREWIKPCGFLSFLTFALQKQRQKDRISFCYLNQQTTWNPAEINVITQVLCSVQAAKSETELLGQHEDKCAGNKCANFQPPHWNCVSNVDAFWKDFHCPLTSLLGTLGWTQVWAFRAVLILYGLMRCSKHPRFQVHVDICFLSGSKQPSENGYTLSIKAWTWLATIFRWAVVFKWCSADTKGPKGCQEITSRTITPQHLLFTPNSDPTTWMSQHKSKLIRSNNVLRAHQSCSLSVLFFSWQQSHSERSSALRFNVCSEMVFCI